MRFIFNVLQIVFFWIWTLVSALIGFLLLIIVGQKKSIFYASRVWAWPLFWVAGAKIKIEGLENVPLHENVIYASNHESSFDIPVMFAVLPVPIFYLAKTELKSIPFFGWYVNAVGMIFIDRRNHENAMQSIIKAGQEIRKGKNIISFPEGTRPRDGEMKMFKRGTFILALENNIDVVPVAIIGSKEVNPPGYKITSGTITVRIGEPIKVDGFNKGEPDKLAIFVEEKVREMRKGSITNKL